MPQERVGSAKAARRRMRKKAAGTEVRRKKEFTYRGFTLDELRAMTLQDVVDLLPARARRSFVRGLDDERLTFLEKLRANGTEEAVRTHCRDVPILPDFMGRRAAWPNGKGFGTAEIRGERIGHYIAKFGLTRNPGRQREPAAGATRAPRFMRR